MTVEDYLAAGGTITILPPGAAAYGYSIHQPEGVLPPSDFCAGGQITMKEAMKRFFDEQKSDRRRKTLDEARAKSNESARRTRQVRIEKLCRLYREGHSIDSLARDEGCQPKRIKELLRAGSIDLAPTPRPRKDKPQRPPSNSAKRQMALALHEDGLDLDQIAAQMGTKRKNVREMLARAGVILRNEKGRKPVRILTESEVAEICRLYQLGHGTPELSKQFAISKWSISKAIRANGIEIRRSGIYAPKTGTKQGGRRK